MISLREACSIVALVAIVAGVWLAWPQLPERIPTHFLAAGAPDGYGPKAAIWFLPAISIFLYLLLTVVTRFPRSFNYPVKVTDENRPRLEPLALGLLGWVKAEVLFILAWITLGTIRVALGKAAGLGPAFLFVSLGVVAVTIGWYMRGMFRAA